ncbi:hypothetical protein DFH29DRAFT_878645 [Suillus ampliporus]|nr:hypothetical protein DFH29DRAFT_878645 [Suillus ampliporus]
MPNGHAVLFPYFEGYYGTPSSGLVQSQQGGVMRNALPYCQFSDTTTIAMHIPLCQKCVHCPSASLHIASSLHVDEVASLLMMEQDILQSLVEGKGIMKYEHIRLLEVCGNFLGVYFLPYMLKASDWSPGPPSNFCLSTCAQNLSPHLVSPGGSVEDDPVVYLW